MVVLTARVPPGLAPAGPRAVQLLPPQCTACENIRAELVGRRYVDPRSAATVELTACAREPSERTPRQVQQVLDSFRTAGR
ncbi:hypothetical protein [Streptomyces sp. CBMA123]|uniref:hypothetical protein n=1 Tax=Streptomyces sp. CBMA123 TaxID=1896313 RepID=UPI001661C978|nr:hypothetical protein [Streptomyces sp. CBMA123]